MNGRKDLLQPKGQEPLAVVTTGSVENRDGQPEGFTTKEEQSWKLRSRRTRGGVETPTSHWKNGKKLVKSTCQTYRFYVPQRGHRNSEWE